MNKNTLRKIEKSILGRLELDSRISCDFIFRSHNRFLQRALTVDPEFSIS